MTESKAATTQAVQRDPSTLSALTPAQPRELSYRSFRSSARMQGSHLLLLRRPSRVAEAAREYVAGDPVHLIDWKAYARTDQLIMREKRDEAAARIMIAVDISDTMQWPVRPTGAAGAGMPAVLPPTKAEIATRIALHVAHVHLKRGDMVELWLHGMAPIVPASAEDSVRPVVPPRGPRRWLGARGTRVDETMAVGGPRRFVPRSPSDVAGLFNRLERQLFSPEALALDFQAAMPPVAGRQSAADVALWIGDGLHLGPEVISGFLKSGRRQAMMHVLSSMELEVNWLGADVAYFDEDGVQPLKEYQGQHLRQEQRYDHALARWRDKLQKQLQTHGAIYLSFNDATRLALYHKTLQALGLLTD